MFWVVCEPIAAAMFGMTAQAGESAQRSLLVLRVLWYAIPVVICVLSAAWFVLVLVRRQPTTYQGGVY
jgi:cytochrome bd-type quinol oxidase subunit 1